MRIFITHILPEELIARYGLSFAAYNFSKNLISGGGFDKVYTTMPLNVSGDLQCNVPGCELIYSHMRTKGHLLSRLSTFFEQFHIFCRIPRRSSIWLYNLGILNAYLFLLVRLFKPSVKIYVIELDFTPPMKTFSLMSLFLWFINNSDGLIKLADSELFNNKNSICLAGVTPEHVEAPLVEQVEPTFLLSGALNPQISSIPMILDAFAQVPECKLHITGRFDDMVLMDRYTSNCKNIVYHGVLTFKKYIDILHSVTYQLSLRDPEWGDNSCNFPSKIIEALLHNRAVVSTMHYSQIEGIDIIETERTVDSFVMTLRMLCKNSSMRYVNQGNKTTSMFSVKVWNYWMSELEKR